MVLQVLNFHMLIFRPPVSACLDCGLLREGPPYDLISCFALLTKIRGTQHRPLFQREEHHGVQRGSSGYRRDSVPGSVRAGRGSKMLRARTLDQVVRTG